MEKYGNLSGNSGVESYEIGSQHITVVFVDGKTYLYNDDRPGTRDVEHMKKLARSGAGLSTYVSQHVKKNYAERLR